MSFQTFTVFFVWFFILIFLSYLIDQLWSRLGQGKKHRFFITPGIIVHELSHALACLVSGAKIHRIRFFARQGGFVEHTKPRFPLIGKVIISLAPLFGCTLSLVALAYLLGFYRAFPSLNFNYSYLANFKILLISALDLFKTHWQLWQFWLFLWLVISLSIAIAPSKVDLKHAFWGLVFLFLLGALVIYIKDSAPFLETLINKYLGRVVSLGVMMELVALIVTLPFWLFKKIF